jgi:hypothetical protein
MYLIGKGELFQNILDGILDLLEDPATPSIQDSDSLLNLSILRNAAKLVNLDEDAFLRAISMRVSVSTVVLKVVSSDHFRLCGNAMSTKLGIKLISFTPPEFSEIFAKMWATHKVVSYYICFLIFLLIKQKLITCKIRRMFSSNPLLNLMQIQVIVIYLVLCGYWIKNMSPKDFLLQLKFT